MMHHTKSTPHQEQRYFDQQSTATIEQGRRIINVGPIDSKLVTNRSAGPGDPQFDQRFGGTMNDTFARGTAIHDNDALRTRTRALNDKAAPASTSLLGGVGKAKDTRGDAFHDMASLARAHKEQVIHNSMDEQLPIRRQATGHSQMGRSQLNDLHHSISVSDENIAPGASRMRPQ